MSQTAVGTVLLFGMLLASSAVWTARPGWAAPGAAAVSAPSPTPSSQAGLDTDFLLLPAYDLELSRALNNSSDASGAKARVGDALPLQVSEISLPPGLSAVGLSLAIPAGNSSLDEQGFAIEGVVSAASTSGTSGSAGLKATLVPLRPGRLTVPSLAIVAPGVNGGPARPIARTNPLPVEVASAIGPNDPKPQEPAAARPPLMIDFPTWLLVTAGFFALLLLGAIFYGLFRWSRSYRARRPAKPPGPPLSEDEAALLALMELEKSDSLRTGNYKKYAFRVSEILKTYIGARYRFDALECTTRELFAQLETQESGAAAHAAHVGRRGALRELFERLDRVKFTDHQPPLPEASGFVVEARQFVQGTRKPTVTSKPVLTRVP
jgi:hypothetical protein